MRQNPNSRRSRGRGGRKPSNPRNQIFDSNGPGTRVRGNSAQIYEKYQQLARDAASSGDRIAAENFYQHAEHYYRLMDAAAANRSGNAPDNAQPRSDAGASNGQAEAAGGTAAVAGAREGGSGSPKEATSERPPESVAALIEAVEQGQGEDAQTASEEGNGKGGRSETAKPARRTRSRRTNGSANGKEAPEKAASDAAPAEDEPEERNEDPNPVSA